MAIKGTTILAVQKNGKSAIGGDGQVTFGQNTVMKHGAKKVRTLYNGKVVAGFAGSVADAFALSEKFEAKLEEYSGNLERAAVELAREWRTDKMLRKLEAMLIVMNQEQMFILSGTGEVITPDNGIASIGSGSNFALSAARALSAETALEPKEIVEKSLKIASEICVYTNDHITILEI